MLLTLIRTVLRHVRSVSRSWCPPARPDAPGRRFAVPISASTYYEWITKTPTRRQLRDTELIAIIAAQREDRKTGKFVQTLGSRKMWIRLRGQGHEVARCTVERIMREQGWEGARYGSKHQTTIADGSHSRYPDRADRNFCAPTPNRW